MFVNPSDRMSCKHAIQIELANRSLSNRVTTQSDGIGGPVMVTIHDWSAGPNDQNHRLLMQLFRIAAEHGFRVQAV